MWVVSRKSLALVRGSRVIRHASLTGTRLPTEGQVRLALDAAAHRMWIVTTQTAPTRALEFDLANLRLIRSLTWGELVADAVALRGHLYLSSDLGVGDLGPRAKLPAFIPGLRGAVGPIALDPTRHRLIAADLGSPTEVWTYRPGERPIAGRDFLPLTNGSLAVVKGAIWIGGESQRGAVVAQLDPRTLRPRPLRPLGLEFGAGAVIAGAGEDVLWVSSMTDANALACLDATTGRVEQRWRVNGVNAVASDRGGALAATSSGLLGLVLSDCRG
jgi:hypothetical protein